MEDIAQPFQEQWAEPSDPAFFTNVVHAVKLLLAAPEVDFQHLHGLCLAAYTGNIFMVHRLMRDGADVNGQVPFLHEVPDTSLSPAQKDSSVSRGSRVPFCMPLIASASNGYQTTVGMLLDYKKPTLVNAMSSSGLTVLSSAIICNSIPVVMHLLQEHDIDTSIQFQGHTPIMLAAQYGWENGRTVLHAAIQWNQHSIINLLLGSGRVDVNRKDSEGRTTLSIAARLGSVQSIERLVDIDISATDNNGKSAYEIAVEERWDNVAILLAEYAAKDPGTK
ncbi:ankyrin repeat-containing domain protein [Armillaria novae-zelandiae]|uniref:Ankyrin repeat-containing domain protein n=1 Tax=Armillaria novae-zelandiae TaxID=153914 RepID=A0AA39NVQ7_9AGAR|nr:ankyrin repeat-containing domain protein [Armillaria novae-zelandiae]